MNGSGSAKAKEHRALDLAAFYGISFRLNLPKYTKFRCGSLARRNSVLSAISPYLRFLLSTPSDLLSQRNLHSSGYIEYDT